MHAVVPGSLRKYPMVVVVVESLRNERPFFKLPSALVMQLVHFVTTVSLFPFNRSHRAIFNSACRYKSQASRLSRYSSPSRVPERVHLKNPLTSYPNQCVLVRRPHSVDFESCRRVSHQVEFS